jgi:NitT/TauT family transport system substrate-binding protein
VRGWGRDGLGTGAQGRGREGAEGVDVDYALKDLPYGRWRTLDAEDSVRFFALRLHEAGMIKTSPQKIIAQGTDWRFLNEVKKELKG